MFSLIKLETGQDEISGETVGITISLVQNWQVILVLHMLMKFHHQLQNLHH